MFKWLKRLKFLRYIFVGLALVVAVLIVSCIVCRDEETPYFKKGWVEARHKQTSGALERMNPFYKPSKADKMLKDWPAGTKIIEIQPHEDTIYIAIPPSGEVLIPEDEKGVTVYEKPKRSWGPELRPWVGGGLTTRGAKFAAAGGVDVFKVKIIKDIHAGPALAYNGELSGGGSVGVTAWRNIDLRGLVTVEFTGEEKGTVTYGVAVGIGIEELAR